MALDFPTTLAALLTLPGIGVVTLIIVQLLKRHLPDGWVTECAVGLGIVIALLASLALGRTSPELLGIAALIGFGGSTSAAGLWDLVKRFNVLPTQAGLKGK